MKLQVALDFLSGKKALQIAADVEDCVDILEAGTPLIKSEGIKIVSRLKKNHLDKIILADLKTMDIGFIEAEMAFKAGADIVTVCAAAGEATVMGAVEAAKKFGKKILVDLIGVSDRAEQAERMLRLNADYIGVHTGIDQQKKGVRLLGTLNEFSHIEAHRLAVAGGINEDNIEAVARFRPAIVVVGGGITGSDHPARAARELKTIIRKFSSEYDS